MLLNYNDSIEQSFVYTQLNINSSIIINAVKYKSFVYTQFKYQSKLTIVVEGDQKAPIFNSYYIEV